MTEFKKIFLQPECCVEDQDVGRMWCQDQINDCEEGNKWTEYLLASDVNKRIAELEAALLNIRQQGYMKKLITHNDRLLSYTSHLEGQIEYLESKLKDQGNE
jgi:hypothetical protein